MRERTGDHHAALGAHHADVAIVRALLQLVDRGFLPVMKLVAEPLFPGPVLLAVERGRHGDPELGDRALHVRAQLRRGSRLHAERTRTSGLGEVIDVAPVERSRLVHGLALEQLLYDRLFSDPVRTEREQVVAVVMDADREPCGIDRARLPDDLDRLALVRRRIEGNHLRIAAPE